MRTNYRARPLIDLRASICELSMLTANIGKYLSSKAPSTIGLSSQVNVANIGDQLRPTQIRSPYTGGWSGRRVARNSLELGLSRSVGPLARHLAPRASCTGGCICARGGFNFRTPQAASAAAFEAPRGATHAERDGKGERAGERPRASRDEGTRAHGSITYRSYYADVIWTANTLRVRFPADWQLPPFFFRPSAVHPFSVNSRPPTLLPALV